MPTFNVLVLPGDGIGPEVTAAATKVLEAVAARWGHAFHFSEELVGGAAIDAYGYPLRQETIQAAKRSDAVLFGAVGGPRWDNASVRPEAAILGLRKALGLYANLRPVRVLPGMEESSAVKSDRIRGTDMIIIRELTGGLYFAKPKRRWTTAQGRRGVDTLRYTEREVERILRVGFELARGRRKKLTSVDKANVLESSRLWREVANEVAQDYPDVELEHALVDSCAMQLVANPTRFDVVVMENMFGDILSDEAAVLVASLGMLPSASLAGLPQSGGRRRRTVMGLYEPIHGTAPDIAGQGKANPVGTILSASFMLRYSLGLAAEADAITRAVEDALASGLRTPDIASGGSAVSTRQMTDAIVGKLTSR
jgi:3-isopropylmalate dehydrogenase